MRTKRMKRLSLLLVGLIGVVSAYGSSHQEVSNPFTIDGITYQVLHYWETSGGGDWVVPAPRHAPNGQRKGVVGPGEEQMSKLTDSDLDKLMSLCDRNTYAV